MKEQRVIQVFVGSPSDVSSERERAFEVIERLNRDTFLPEGWRFEGIGWDKNHYPQLASRSPQEAITQGLPRPGDCDVAVFIFWSRMGTALREGTFEQNGAGPEPTGSLWEYYDALESPSETAVFVYRSMCDVPQEKLDPDQFKRVKQFFSSFKDEKGRYRSGYKKYHDIEEFARQLEQDLKSLIARPPAATEYQGRVVRKDPYVRMRSEANPFAEITVPRQELEDVKEFETLLEQSMGMFLACQDALPVPQIIDMTLQQISEACSTSGAASASSPLWTHISANLRAFNQKSFHFQGFADAEKRIADAADKLAAEAREYGRSLDNARAHNADLEAALNSAAKDAKQRAKKGLDDIKAKIHGIFTRADERARRSTQYWQAKTAEQRPLTLTAPVPGYGEVQRRPSTEPRTRGIDYRDDGKRQSLREKNWKSSDQKK